MTQTRVRATATRRRAILEAGLACFTAKGIAATTMEDIRAASGASIGSIYHHFESKERLAAALYLEAIREYQQGLVGEVTRHRSAERGVRAAVIYHLRWIRERPDWARFLLHGGEADILAQSGDELRAMNEATMAELRAWLVRQAEDGAMVRLAPDTVLPLLLGPAQAFGRRWLAGRASTTMEEAERIFADAAWKSLRL